MKINFNFATLPQKVNATAIKSHKNNVSFKGNDYGNDTFEKKPTTYYKKGSLEWALNWDFDERRKELNSEFEKNKNGMSFWKRNFTSAVEDLKNSYKKTLENEQIMVTTLLQNKTEIQNEINIMNNAKQELDEKAVTVAKEAEQVQKLSNASRIANAFKVDNEGGLDDCIAGYDSEKQLLRSAFVEQVALEKAGNAANVPNGILWYGPIDTGKTAMAMAVAREADSCLVELNPSIADFAKKVYDTLQEAKDRYIDTQQRTVILINEIDSHLEKLNFNNNNIAQSKTWLDNCASIPKDNSSGFATTFFFTTNHPDVVTSEILLKDNRISKLIALEPASENNIKEIIEFYLNKLDKNGFVIENEEIDYDKIIQKMNPNDEKGAFGNGKIAKIVERAFTDFNKDIDKEKSLEEHLLARIDKAKRNIPKEELQEFKEQVEDLSED